MSSVPETLAAAKLWLVSAGTADLPYLSEGLFALVAVESDAVATMAADASWRLYVNPGWAGSAGVEEVARELAHQLWHLLLDHAGRARDRRVDAATAVTWGAAADLAVCDALGAEGVLPDVLAQASASLRAKHPVTALAPGRGAEEYFDALGRLAAGGEGPQEEGDLPTPGVLDPDARESADDWVPGADDRAGADDGSAADAQHRAWELPPDLEAEGAVADDADGIRRAVAAAYLAEQSARQGEGSVAVERWAQRMLDPRIPWERLLAQAARRGIGWTSGRTDTTFARPNRRAASLPGVLLPGWRRQTPAVACVIDTSGSVDEALLGRALAEVDGALRGLGVAGSSLTVLTCDASVQTVRRVRRAQDAALVGGGGTDLRVALAEVERLRPRPTLTVVFTDGLTPWPDAPPPGSAVVVALLLREGEQPPDVPAWAITIECESTH